jgi:O-antigen ligase
MSIAQDRLPRAMVVRRGPSGIVNLTSAGPGAVSARNLPLVVQWSFLLFIGLISTDVGIAGSPPFSKLSGVLFFATYFFYHNPLSRKRSRNRSFPSIPPVMAWFVIYAVVYAVNGLFLPTERLGAFFERVFTLVQSIIFLWIGSDILKDEKIAKKALLAYLISSVVASIGLLSSLPGFGIGDEGSTRASAIGTSGYGLAAATVVVLGLWLNLAHKSLVKGVLMCVSMLALSTALVITGSRTAFLASMIGLSVYLVPYWKHRWRMSTVIVGVIAIAGLAYMAANSPVFYERWLNFTEKGDTSGRDWIFEQSLEMISERPLVGWRPVEFEYELAYRVPGNASGIRSAHNIFLHLFMEVGVVGAVPFLIGLWLCGQGAWKARNRNLGLLPLALWVVSVATGMGSNIIYGKLMWFFFVVTVAARGERKGRGRILVGRPIENGIQTSSGKLNSSNVG